MRCNHSAIAMKTKPCVRSIGLTSGRNGSGAGSPTLATFAYSVQASAAATSGIAPITSQARTRVPIGHPACAVKTPIDISINAGTSPQGTSRHAAPLTFQRAIHASS